MQVLYTSRIIEGFYDTATECDLPHGITIITQCYLPSDTSEHTPPKPQPYRLDLPT